MHETTLTLPYVLLLSNFKPQYLALTLALALALTLVDDENKDEIGGIAGLILECIRSCNSDVRPLVVQNILCVGGGSMVPGTVHENFQLVRVNILLGHGNVLLLLIHDNVLLKHKYLLVVHMKTLYECMSMQRLLIL